MNYADNKKILKTFYEQAGLESKFDEDSIYLEKAFNCINKLWQDNLDQIETVNYLMIAEAPLWGQVQKYIYNPNTNNSQVFHLKDLGDNLNRNIPDKTDFLKVCNEIGLLIVDISPFALNQTDTAINYRATKKHSRKLKKREYKQLVSLTIPTYFAEKLKAVKEKKSADIKIFFRYAKVKNTFQDLISKVLLDNKFINHINEVGDISQKGGGINKAKLGRIINTNIKQPVVRTSN